MTLLDNLATFFDVLGSTGLVRFVIVAAVLFGLWRGLERAGFTQQERNRTWLAVTVPLFAWFALIWVLALADVFRVRPGAFPALPLAIFAPVLLGLVLMTRSRRIAAALDALPPSWLVGLQVYRVFGGAFLVQLALGHLTAFFALPAGIGDVLVGLLALPVALYLNRHEDRGRAIAVAWNVFGILDLLVAMAMGFLASTGRFGIASAPRPIIYPLVMIPAFAVPLSLLLHGVSLWQLKRRAGRSGTSRKLGSPMVVTKTA